MQKKPLVSIIIPVYNEGKYLDSCLSSLSSQTYPEIEIIVTDDGSTDESIEIAKKYTSLVLSQIHQGPGAARNLGVSKANGAIIVLADADMKFDKHYIEFITKPIREGKAIGTFNKEERVANTDNVWSQCWAINSGLPIDRRLPKNYSDTEIAFRAIEKKYFEQGGGYEEKVGYTDDLTLSRKLGIKAVNAPNAINYHYNPASLSEVFYSARWIGRSSLFSPTLKNLFRYSLLNSVRVAMKYILIKKAPLVMIIFKIIYDFGMFNGIFIKSQKTYK